jgi:hypothetical protein
VIAEVRRAIAAALTARGIRAFDHAADRIAVPCADIAVMPIDYNSTFGGAGSATQLGFTIRLYAARPSDRAGQDALDAMLDPTGPRSVREALLTDPTLGGLVETTQVQSGADTYGYAEVNGVLYFTADVTVAVLARGN